jgi:hypothetical protein
MKLIRLSRKGKIAAMVSDRDYNRLSSHRWNAIRITGTGGGGKTYRYGFKVGRRVGASPNAKNIWMHNEIMRPPKGMEVDHIDRNPLNNTRSNLRVVPHWINCMNKGKRKGCTSRYFGVCKTVGKSRWSAFFRRMDGTKGHAGYHDTQKEAAEAYDRVVKRLYGKYARTNF